MSIYKEADSLYCACMNTVIKAQRIIETAAQQLTGLMQECMQRHEYEALAEIAKLATHLASAIDTADAKAPRVAPKHNRSKADSRAKATNKTVTSTSPTRTNSRASAASKPTSQRKPGTYPKFRIDGDRLVKVGWSKKRREEYEHRADWSSVELVVKKLKTAYSPNKTFTIEEIFPVTDADQNEVPTYQVYLTFAWLRESNTLQKCGRDGYAYDPGALDKDSIAEIRAITKGCAE
ncbi:MAG: hypothetical protein DHS20C11_05110 [Lysobacteraceae bacterium]|nr:MAG: hypothetical protein DHS20C11_05110 [Xanthomonadaceae bacterium]